MKQLWNEWSLSAGNGEIAFKMENSLDMKKNWIVMQDRLKADAFCGKPLTTTVTFITLFSWYNAWSEPILARVSDFG